MERRRAGTVALALSIVACTTGESRIHIVIDGDGSTNPPPGAHRFERGTRVIVTATPAAGATFVRWSGAAGPAVNPIALVIQDDQELVAHFARAGEDGSASSSGSSSSSGGSSSSSGGCAAQANAVSIDAGGAGAGAFAADGYFSGGSVYSTKEQIDTSLIRCDPPPVSVLQTERWGEFTYTIAGRAPQSAQTVTLYFEESFCTSAGARTFDVAINGSTVLTAFDIFAAAGGMNRAIAKTFDATADASGNVVIRFIRGRRNEPKVCGIVVAGDRAP